MKAAGGKLRIQVVGLATIAEDVTPELALATIEWITILGALHASKAVKAALSDRIGLWTGLCCSPATRALTKLVAEIEKRISTIGRSKSHIGWERTKDVVQELDHLRKTVAGQRMRRIGWRRLTP